MIIEQVDLYHISQQLVSPFETSFGRQEERQSIILTLHSGGLRGWGECAATIVPGFSYETVVTAWHVLSDFLIPAVLGMDLEEPGQISEWMRFVRGHPLAKAALDAAAWDITAQRDGLSFAEKLSEPYKEPPRTRVEVGVSIGIQTSLGKTLAVIQSFLEKGYKRIKLKIGPEHDQELVRAARNAFTNIPIMVDANAAYTMADARIFQAMDNFNLLMFEQPLAFDDIIDHSRLRQIVNTPICLDESIRSASLASQALMIGACDIINIKPGRVGGWTEARKIHDICRENNVPVWCGGMLETGIGRAALLALASLPGFTMPGDISATERYYAHDIARPDFILNPQESTIDVPSEPGLGVEIDAQRLEEVTIRHGRFRA